MYSLPKTGQTALTVGVIGAIGWISGFIGIAIIVGVILTIFSLYSKRIAIEPAQFTDGKYHLAFTKNGQITKWLFKRFWKNK